jgi:hypothetical protein
MTRLFLVIRWDSAIESVGEWFSYTTENAEVWAAESQLTFKLTRT